MTTICAISTPPGTGGIATARISGPRAIEIANAVWRGKPLSQAASHTLHLGTVFDPADGAEIDSAVAAIFRAPRSFTGEETVELTVHGSRWIQRELINLLIRQGASLAEPGEFTRRAVANGRLDLAQAEAVGDMIAASSRAAQRIALAHMRGHYSGRLDALRSGLVELAALVELELDFSEEDVEFAPRDRLIALAEEIHSQVSALADSFAAGRAIKEGIPVAIVGATNAGKSTLLNRLLGEERAIVSDIHGTTRDSIEDTLEIHGTLFRLTDTAGLRATSDPIEAIGIDRARSQASRASLLIWVIDPADAEGTRAAWAEIEPLVAPTTRVIALLNKADKHAGQAPALPDRVDLTLRLSALRDSNLAPLLDAIARLGAPADLAPDLTVTNARHYEALTRAASSIARAKEGMAAGIPGDLLAQDLRETIAALGSITEPIAAPDLLAHVFAHFCIGK